MSGVFKISGKRADLSKAAKGETGWNFSVRPGGWIIAERKGERRRFFISESKGQLGASLGGFLWHGQIVSTGRSAAGVAGGDADLTAQFPGKVRKILVKAGDQVREGDPLLLVEAMKMEFAIKAPFDGLIKVIKVAEGRQLSPGDRFLDMEKTGGNGNGG